MTSPDKQARCNKPESATSDSELAAGAVRKFEQGLQQMVEKLGREEVNPVGFREFLGGMRTLLAAIGREAVVQALEATDRARAFVEVSGQQARFRGFSEREWLTPFGKITMMRRTYRADGAG